MVNRRAEEPEREQRIRDEAVVDAYGPEERAMGWYYYLEERLRFPFSARCTAKRAISPLHIGERVKVVAMAPEEECQREMFVEIKWRDRTVAVPLSQVSPLDADEDTNEAVEDWHYWVEQGYEF